MKISIIGTGYVGLSLAVLISQKYNVTAYDIDKEKVELINNKKSTISDQEIENFLSKKKLKLNAVSDKSSAYNEADFIIIATPTNYDEKNDSFDTSSVELVISDVSKFNPKATIIIKSTVPLGFTERMRQKYKSNEIFFSPEFLRESKALYDNLYPSRIVIGSDSERGKLFADILSSCALKEKKDIPIMLMSSHEAESFKLFSNTYLAMRISFFNELDSYCEVNKLSSKKVIKGLGYDPRIGNYYNNPSFGYGGYCLPKDTQQLLNNYSNVPNKIIKAIVDANKTRKIFISEAILSKNVNIVGVYRLVMKKGSDNFRESAVFDVINYLIEAKKEVIVYEPYLKKQIFNGAKIINDLKQFKEKSEIIVANRWDDDLSDFRDKVYSRDIFYIN